MVWFLFAIASAIISSFTTVIEKKALANEHSLSFSTVYAFAALLFSLPLLWLADFSKLTPLVGAIVYAGSVFATVGLYFTAKGTKHMEMSVSSPLLITSLLFVPILAFFFVGEQLNLQQVAGIILIFAGVLILESIVTHGKLFYLPKDGNKYFYLMIAAAFMFSISAITDKIALASVSPYTFLFTAHVFIAVNSLLLLVILDKKFKTDVNQLFSHDLKSTLTVGLLAVVQRLLFTLAISTAFISISLAIKRLNSLFSVFLGGKLFHEKHISEKVVACVVMLLGAALLALS